ncbi:MAG: hypothetical protein KatS3mg024_0259 [Armatimonadota bacterium]|nr:MAG: hypothetical protein KatS3mg024_0259 [Armatimonadota bacterium]
MSRQVRLHAVAAGRARAARLVLPGDRRRRLRWKLATQGCVIIALALALKVGEKGLPWDRVASAAAALAALTVWAAINVVTATPCPTGLLLARCTLLRRVILIAAATVAAIGLAALGR